ncbi:MAG: D-glycerate 3-kinase [Glaciecola sp.]|jgi:D-glycerate 3-kinase
MQELTTLIEQYIIKEKLPEAYLDVALKWFMPLCDSIQLHHNKSNSLEASTNRPYFIGVNGCQGSGKSTLSGLMSHLFNTYYEKKSIVLSLDDFYYTRAERIKLAKTVHPLLAMRGVPGTHDIQMMSTVIQSLALNKAIDIPTFDKSIDDRAPSSQWQKIISPVDIVIIEGWCWGTQAQKDEALETAVNELEEKHDSNGTWRHYVNSVLKNTYTPLYPYMNTWVFLQAPSFDAVYTWRLQQEEKLKERVGNTSNIMSNEDIIIFIQYYQRLTQHTLCTLGSQADFIFELDNKRNITQSRSNAK